MTRYEGYQGNPNLPREDYIHSYTQHEKDEFIKCVDDPVYFALKYIKIVNVDRGLIPFEMWDFQKEMLSSFHENRFSICKLPRQVGKALPLDEDILTPNGFMKFGDLEVGDIIYGQDGKETKVNFITPVMYNRECYEIEFDDGSVIKCDAEHLWKVNSSDWNHEGKVLDTNAIIDLLHKKKNNGSGLYVQMNDAITYKHENLPIDPYALGVWLGDGNSHDCRITCHVNDSSEYIENFKYHIGTIGYDKRNDNIRTLRFNDFHADLRKAGLLKNKHIPNEYLTSSIDQRIELVRGLMDTDGSIRSNGGLEFYQKDENLVDDFILILRSLGVKTRKRIKIVNNRVYFNVLFASSKYSFFKLRRKLDQQNQHTYHKKNYRLYIKSINKVDSVPVRCIKVDNIDHMFLIGRNLIPTHNTTTAVAYLLHSILFNESYNVAILANKSSTAREIMGRLQLAFEYLPRFLQQGVKEWNKGNIELANGSKAQADSTSGSSVRGKSFNIIFLDEFAHIPNNIAEAFFMSTYPTISSGDTTKVIIVSTPNGLNLFYKMWSMAVDKKSDYVPIEIHWSMVPGRTLEWKEQVIKNTSQDQFDQEFECVGGKTLVEVRHKKTGKTEKIEISDLYDQTFSNNTEYEIMTKNGFENFQGVQKSDSRIVFRVVLENDTTLNCTPNHKFKTPFGFVELTRLFEGDVIETIDGFKVIDKICVNNTPEDVYDVIDAGIDHQYYTNGILSHNCNFVGSTNTLIHPSKIRSLVFNTPIAREGDIHVYEQPVPSHTYVIVADVAEGQGLDYSTFSVIDVTQIPYKQVAKYKNNKISPFLFPTVIYSAAQKYNEAFILVEINSIGLQVADILHNDLAYENLIKVRNGKNKAGQQATPGFTRQMQFGLKTSVQTKKIGCANLKSLIENDKLIINDEDTIMELTTFSASKASFAAEEGNNDDLVMTLVNFGWLTAQKYFKESVNTDIRRTLQEEQMNIMDNDIVPFGAIDNGIDDPWEKQKDKDGDMWFEDRKNRAPFDDLNWDWRAKL